MTIQRYSYRPSNVGDGEPDKCDDPEGESVDYADHDRVVAELGAENAALKATVERLSAPVSDEEGNRYFFGQRNEEYVNRMIKIRLAPPTAQEAPYG